MCEECQLESRFSKEHCLFVFGTCNSKISTQFYFIHTACTVLLPCACFVASKSRLNDFFHRDCKLPPTNIKKYMEWQAIYYPLQLPFDFVQSITMHVIFYQCSSQQCPLAFHLNITIINISTPYIAPISWAAPKIYYPLVHAEFREISSNIIILVLVLPLVMLYEHVMQNFACKNNVVNFFL